MKRLNITISEELQNLINEYLQKHPEYNENISELIRHAIVYYIKKAP